MARPVTRGLAPEGPDWPWERAKPAITPGCSQPLGQPWGTHLLGEGERHAVETPCVGRAWAPAPARGRGHTFSQEPGTELPSCWLSSWLSPTVQAPSSMGSSDARRNCGEQERMRVFSWPWPGPFPRPCVPGHCAGTAAGNGSLFPHPSQPSFHQPPSSPNTPGTPDTEEAAVAKVCAAASQGTGHQLWRVCRQQLLRAGRHYCGGATGRSAGAPTARCRHRQPRASSHSSARSLFSPRDAVPSAYAPPSLQSPGRPRLFLESRRKQNPCCY